MYRDLIKIIQELLLKKKKREKKETRNEAGAAGRALSTSLHSSAASHREKRGKECPEAPSSSAISPAPGAVLEALCILSPLGTQPSLALLGDAPNPARGKAERGHGEAAQLHPADAALWGRPLRSSLRGKRSGGHAWLPSTRRAPPGTPPDGPIARPRGSTEGWVSPAPSCPHPRALRTRGTFGRIPITECCQLLPRRAAAPLQRRCLLCSPLSPY